MDKLIDYISNNLKKSGNNTYLELKLVSVVYNKTDNLVTFRFIYENGEMTKDLKDQIIQLINKYYSKYNLNVDCKVKKSFLDEDAITEIVYREVVDNCKSILNFDKDDIKVKIEDKDVKIDISITEQFYGFLESKNFESLLIHQLDNNFFGHFSVMLNPKKSLNTGDILKEKEAEIERFVEATTDTFVPKVFDIELGETIMGINNLDSLVNEISSIKHPQNTVQIAGKINRLFKRSFLSKKKDEAGNQIEKEYFSLELSDHSGSISCVVFPSKVDFENVSLMEDGMEITALGDVEQFNNKLNFKIKTIAHCKLPLFKEEPKTYKSVNNEYFYIKPEPYLNISQDNFLTEKKEPNEFLKNNDVVVFDFETTGLEYDKNEIIEIGAVKLKNGEITETFSCFVKPSKPIPEEITNLTHITDDMVKDAYTIDKVIPDFYKFCYNCVLSGYNIAGFDCKFLNYQAEKLGYKFDNRVVDAFDLARKNVAGAKNFKLISICNKLGVSLEGAHRAVNDTAATAEVLKLISYNVPAKI